MRPDAIGDSVPGFFNQLLASLIVERAASHALRYETLEIDWLIAGYVFIALRCEPTGLP